MEKGVIFWQKSNSNLNGIERLSAPRVNQGIVLSQTLFSPISAGNTQKDISEQLLPVRMSSSTVQQINYITKHENKLLIEDTHYIKPKNEVMLISSVDVHAKESGLTYREKADKNNDWLTIVLFLELMLFAFVKHSFPKYIKTLTQSAFNYYTAYKMFREKNNSVLIASLSLEIFYYIVISVFIYQVIVFYGIESRFDNFYLFLICLGILVTYYITKILLYRFIGLLTEKQLEIGEYLFNMSNFNHIVGILIFPIVTFIAFSPFENTEIAIVIGLLVVFSFYVLLIFRGIGILLQKHFSIFYLFLYLCALEFLPVFLLYKLVIV
ncbi:MAG: DUF4271 domain-containing protein [Bacteroidales bacterium]|jgi:hypothetical protein|nr:DUF4271 domain-containing protein [Bacteroidales bacterium]